jgi:putative tricarboxylic transport membrane protein
VASAAGGVIGALVLTAAILVARPIILAFGTGEMLLLVLLGISMVCVLSGSSLVKGIIACGLGLLVGAVGAAPATSEYRMIMGNFYLADGVPLVAVALGVFALPEIIDLLRRNAAISSTMSIGRGWWQGAVDCWIHKGVVVRTSAIGCLIGALPGIGGSVVDWIAYGHTVQTAKDKSQFGKGDIRGVIGVEASNNSVQGGALVPTLIFGIPGSGSTAIFLAGLILIGLQPGMAMVEQNLDVTYTIIWSLALANIIGAGFCFLISGQMAKLTMVRYVYLAPYMLAIVFYASFQSSGDWGDMVALIVMGLIGCYLRRFGYSRPAFLIGFVLQNNIETYLYQSMQFYTLGTLAARPLIWALLAIIIVSLYFGLKHRPKNQTEGASGELSAATLWPQAAFLLAALAVVVYCVVDVRKFYLLGSVFPLTVSALLAPLLLYALWRVLARDLRDPILFDAEAEWRQRDEGYVASLGHYVLWILGFVGLTYLVGFLIGIALFFTVFLAVKSPARWPAIVTMTGSVVAFFMAISHFLALDLPRGLLQDAYRLPWPIG